MKNAIILAMLVSGSISCMSPWEQHCKEVQAIKVRQAQIAATAARAAHRPVPQHHISNLSTVDANSANIYNIGMNQAPRKQ